MAGEMPNDDAGRDRDIQRVLRAPLWYLQTTVAGVNHLLMHTLHLVSKDYRSPL